MPKTLVRWLLVPPLCLAVLLGLGSCGGGGGDYALPSIAIFNPTTADSYATTQTGVVLGGSISGASYVHVVNTTTGLGTEGYVNYFDGHGGWFADVVGLVPGANVIVATAVKVGSGARTATDTVTIVRPLQPAGLILNGEVKATATAYWVDTYSFDSGHKFALFADGSGRSTTGNVITEPAGAPVTMAWSYEGAEAIVINGCPICSFQRISRISGSTADSGFYAQVDTVDSGGETALHSFHLNAGSF